MGIDDKTNPNPTFGTVVSTSKVGSRKMSMYADIVEIRVSLYDNMIQEWRDWCPHRLVEPSVQCFNTLLNM
jgi:hypothetical protein